jgi:hypothetical protein
MTEESSPPDYSLFKVILMVGLLITMLMLSIVIYNYTQQMKENPCEFCLDCKNKLILSPQEPILNKEEVLPKEYIYIPIDEVNANLTEI